VEGSLGGPRPDIDRQPGSPAEPLRVEVRSRLDGGWSRGFTIDKADVRADGTEWFRLRRESDGVVLPSWFRADDVVLYRSADTRR